MRWLLFALIVWLSYLFIKKRLSNYQSGRQTKQTDPKRMVRCHYCKVFLPESEALTEGENTFCCHEHRKLAKRDHG